MVNLIIVKKFCLVFELIIQLIFYNQSNFILSEWSLILCFIFRTDLFYECDAGILTQPLESTLKRLFLVSEVTALNAKLIPYLLIFRLLYRILVGHILIDRFPFRIGIIFVAIVALICLGELGSHHELTALMLPPLIKIVIADPLLSFELHGPQSCFVKGTLDFSCYVFISSFLDFILCI